MASWIRSVVHNWDAVLAFTLTYATIAIYLGFGFYFFAWYMNGCAYIIHYALKRR